VVFPNGTGINRHYLLYLHPSNLPRSGDAGCM